MGCINVEALLCVGKKNQSGKGMMSGTIMTHCLSDASTWSLWSV